VLTAQRRWLGTLAALTLALVIVAPSAARAEEPLPPVTLTLDFTEPQSLSVEYGEYWSFGLTGDDYIVIFHGQPDERTVTSTGTPSGYTPALDLHHGPNDSMEYGLRGTLSGDWQARPLGAGSYTFIVASKGTSYTAQTPNPAKLTITPAKLGIDLRMVADDSSPENTIITLKFAGRFVDEYGSTDFPGAPLSPAGSWQVKIVGSDGSTVLERTIDRSDVDDTLSSSLLWAGAKPGEQYVGTADFVPSGASASNFDITASGEVKFTASERTRPAPTSTAVAGTDTDIPAEPDFSVPLWWVLLIGAALAALIAFTVAFAIRLGRVPQSAPATAPVKEAGDDHA